MRKKESKATSRTNGYVTQNLHDPGPNPQPKKPLKKRSKNMGRVHVNGFYVVDLDDPDMIEHAKDALYEDLMNAIKYNQLYEWIEPVEDKTMVEEDICEFLLDEDDDD